MEGVALWLASINDRLVPGFKSSGFRDLPCAKKHVLSAQGVVSDQRGTLDGISLELAKTLHLVEKGLPLLEHRMDLGSVCLEAHPVQRVITVDNHTVDKADASQLLFRVRLPKSRRFWARPKPTDLCGFWIGCPNPDWVAAP